MTQKNFDFMDLLEDDAWFEASARREESVDCEALAGYGWGSHLGSVMGNPQGYSHFSQLRSVVMQTWKQLVTEWNLGIGTESAEAKGQELILARLHQPAAEVQETLMVLLEAKLSKPQGEWEMTETVQAEIRAVLAKVLTQDDWKAIAESASHHIYAQVLRHELVTVEGL